MKTMTLYEKKALQEIKEWELAGPGLLIKSIDILGLPLQMIIRSVPEAVKRSVGMAVMGFMEMLKDVSYWSFSNRGILREAEKCGIRAERISELADQDLEKLDRLARGYFVQNKVIAALEGAGCGLGGLALIAADIPVLLGIGFRSIQQIGMSYGFNMQEPEMVPAVMGVLHAGSGIGVAVKSSVLADMHITAAALAGNMAYREIADRTRTGVVVELLGRSTGILPKQLAENITRRKLSQLIPIAGAAIGAGFNYWFIGNIVVSAYMIFRKMRLEIKYPAGAENSSGRLRLAFRKFGEWRRAV